MRLKRKTIRTGNKRYQEPTLKKQIVKGTNIDFSHNVSNGKDPYLLKHTGRMTTSFEPSVIKQNQIQVQKQKRNKNDLTPLH